MSHLPWRLASRPVRPLLVAGAVAAAAAIVIAVLLGAGSDRSDSGARGSRALGGPGAVAAASRRKPPKYRFLFSSNQDARRAASYGWNLIDVTGKWEADHTPARTRGLIWVGNWDDDTCGWEMSNAELRRKVRSLRGDRKAVGYFYSDEPDPDRCPSAPAAHRARSRLIHRLDPRKFTIMVTDSNSGRASLRWIRLWRGAADYVGLNPYICYQGKRCNFAWLDKVIKAADRARLRYWGVVQAFRDDDEWRWPTSAELRRMLNRWSRSRWSGFMTFAWTWDGYDLSSRPGLLATLKRFNLHGAAGTTAEPASRRTARQLHYTFTGRTSVALNWAGPSGSVRYGRTRSYGRRVGARRARPMPVSSRGPFWEARIGHLRPNTRYHYSIGGGPDHTFRSAPTGPFRFDVQADVGDAASFRRVAATQAQIASDKPSFVLVPGDLTYGNENGKAAVDRHFDDVMTWSRRAAYMPAWGNHEWDDTADDLRNYKGRFAIPHGQPSRGAPGKGCCGEDWGWFDAGAVRFISYPEPYDDATWSDWKRKAAPLMAAAQADPKIRFIVTFGHRPAYSTGYHAGERRLASILNKFGDRHPKYVLNLNGHSHDYERFRPIHGVVHITATGGGADLETPWKGKDGRTARRALHLVHLRVTVTSSGIRTEAVCGPPTPDDDISCRQGEVIDAATITPRS